jgi:hypothetical protein
VDKKKRKRYSLEIAAVLMPIAKKAVTRCSVSSQARQI